MAPPVCLCVCVCVVVFEPPPLLGRLIREQRVASAMSASLDMGGFLPRGREIRAEPHTVFFAVLYASGWVMHFPSVPSGHDTASHIAPYTRTRHLLLVHTEWPYLLSGSLAYLRLLQPHVCAFAFVRIRPQRRGFTSSSA